MTTRYPFPTRADLGRACVDLFLPGAQAAVDVINTHASETTDKNPSELRPYSCNATNESEAKDTWSQIVKDLPKTTSSLQPPGSSTTSKQRITISSAGAR